ncbi:MAG: hypothetical protein RJA70_871 [Pseudomonadota bacterium]
MTAKSPPRDGKPVSQEMSRNEEKSMTLPSQTADAEALTEFEASAHAEVALPADACDRENGDADG